MYECRTGPGQPKKNSVSDTELTTKQLAAKAGVSVATVRKVKRSSDPKIAPSAPSPSGKIAARSAGMQGASFESFSKNALHRVEQALLHSGVASLRRLQIKRIAIRADYSFGGE